MQRDHGSSVVPTIPLQRAHLPCELYFANQRGQGRSKWSSPLTLQSHNSSLPMTLLVCLKNLFIKKLYIYSWSPPSSSRAHKYLIFAYSRVWITSLKKKRKKTKTMHDCCISLKRIGISEIKSNCGAFPLCFFSFIQQTLVECLPCVRYHSRNQWKGRCVIKWLSLSEGNGMMGAQGGDSSQRNNSRNWAVVGRAGSRDFSRRKGDSELSIKEEVRISLATG